MSRLFDRLWRLMGVFHEAATRWIADNALRLSASLSYYTVFSLGPLLLIAVAVAGLVFGDAAATGALSVQLRGLLGKQGAQAVETILGDLHHRANALASVIGLAILLFAASGAFAELQSALNLIWHTQGRRHKGWWGFVHDRLLSFAMVLVIGFLLLVSLMLSAVIAALGNYLDAWFGLPVSSFQLFSNLLSFVLITLLFALIFRVLPDTDISWKDVWVGAALTSLLFSVGKLLIGIYLGKIAIASTYGASASFIIVLTWAYYSSMILFYGAEFTECYSRRLGSRKYLNINT